MFFYWAFFSADVNNITPFKPVEYLIAISLGSDPTEECKSLPKYFPFFKFYSPNANNNLQFF